MKNLKHIYAFAAVCLFAISTAFSAQKTWTGATSTAWGTSSNWSSSGAPGSNDDVIIPANLTNYPVFTSNVSVKTITLNGGSIKTSSSNLSISSYLILNDGTLDMGSGQLSVSGDIDLNDGELIVRGTKLSLSSSKTLTVSGGKLTISSTSDFTLNGSLVLDGGIVDFSGNNFIENKTYTYKSGYVQNPGNFTINDQVINFNGYHALGINLRITNSMTFTHGILETDYDHFITFDYNSTVSGASDSSHIVGPVRKEIRNFGTNTFKFPLGDGSKYAPLEISNYGNARSSDYFDAEYSSYQSAYYNDSMGTGINHVSATEFWSLNRDAYSGTSQTSVRIGLYYDTLRSGGISSYANLRVAHFNGVYWKDEGRGNFSSTSNVAGVLYTSSNVSTFSPFTIGSSTSANPLPIVLIDFQAKPLEKEVNVSWKTSAELNSDYFNVEKSLDGINWTVISTIKGAGNSESISEYGIVDANPVNGLQYYRLKQVDFNGQFEYSTIVPVKFSGLADKINIFPSPATTTLNVSLNNQDNSDVSVNIYNALGQVVMSINGTQSTFTFDIAELKAGIYVVEVVCNGELTQSKLIKN